MLDYIREPCVHGFSCTMTFWKHADVGKCLTPIILVQRLIIPGLIKDLCIMPLRPKTSEMEKGQERKVELLGVEPRAIGLPCQLLC